MRANGSNTLSSGSFVVGLTALLLLAAVVLATLAWLMPVDIDEIDQLHGAYLYSQGKEPLIDFFDHLFLQGYKWTLSFGIDPSSHRHMVVYRLYSVLCGIVMLFIFAMTMKRLLGTRASLMATSLLLSSFPFLLRIPQFRSDAFALCSLSLLFWFLGGNLNRRWHPAILASAVFAGLAVFFRVSLIIFPFAVFISLLIDQDFPEKEKRFVRAFLFGVTTIITTSCLFLLPYPMAAFRSIGAMTNIFKIQFIGEAAVYFRPLFILKQIPVILLLMTLGIFFLLALKRRPYQGKGSVILTSMIVFLPIYFGFLFKRIAFFQQDMLFLLFAALPFIVLFLLHFQRFLRASMKRLSWLAIPIIYLLILTNSGVQLSRIISTSEEYSKAIQTIACRQLSISDTPQIITIDETRRIIQENHSIFFNFEQLTALQELENTKNFFLQTTTESELCFSSDSSHLFRLNPPSLSPPSLAHHFRWSTSILDDWISFIDKYLVYFQPIAETAKCYLWSSNGMSTNDRLVREFEENTPKIMVMDSLLLQLAFRYPSFDEFIMSNYVVVYHPLANRFFAIHQSLGADVIQRWENGEWNDDLKQWKQQCLAQN